MWVRQLKLPMVPKINPFFDSLGSIYLNTTNGTIYYHNGTTFTATAGGGGGSADSAIFYTVYRADTSRANIYAAIAAGGGSTPTLQQVTDVGDTTNNSITFKNSAETVFGAGGGILLDNSSRLREGTITSINTGNKGIAQICGVGYELKWAEGSQYVMNGNGNAIRVVNYRFNDTPTSSNDNLQGFYVGSRWVLDNGITYVCTDATTGNAVWNRVNAITLTTTGNSGAATLINDTLNIPQYAGATYTAGNWLTLNSGVFNFDSTNRVDYTFSAPTSLKLVASSVLNAQLGNVYLAIGDTTEMLRDSLTDHWTAIMGKVNYSDTTTIIATKANVNTKQNYSDTSSFDATRSWVGLQIPSLTGYVPYTGATTDLNLGTHSITAKDGVINHSAGSGTALSVTKGGSGTALSVTKGGNGIALFVEKTSGSGNAMEVQGGVTLLYDLRLTNTLKAEYIDTLQMSTRAWRQKGIDSISANFYPNSNPSGFTSNTGTVTSVGVVAGTGVSIGGSSPITSAGTYTITNTAPDQTVTITASTNVTVTGSYPTFTISATGGGGGGSPLKGIAPVTITAGTGDTLVISITPNTTYTITEATAFTYSGANGLIQKITMNNALDTVTVDTTTLVEGVTYELRVIQGAGGNKILHWDNTGTLFQGGTTATGRPYQDIGAAEISRYFIQKSDALLFVNPVINNRE
jgi:hypothetical protein